MLPEIDLTRCFAELDTFFTEKDIYFFKEYREVFNRIYEPKDPHEWFYIQHLGMGMAIRNRLRKVYLDAEVGGNWDDHYLNVLNAYLDSKVKQGGRLLTEDELRNLPTGYTGTPLWIDCFADTEPRWKICYGLSALSKDEISFGAYSNEKLIEHCVTWWAYTAPPNKPSKCKT